MKNMPALPVKIRMLARIPRRSPTISQGISLSAASAANSAVIAMLTISIRPRMSSRRRMGVSGEALDQSDQRQEQRHDDEADREGHQHEQDRREQRLQADQPELGLLLVHLRERAKVGREV